MADETGGEVTISEATRSGIRGWWRGLHSAAQVIISLITVGMLVGGFYATGYLRGEKDAAERNIAAGLPARVEVLEDSVFDARLNARVAVVEHDFEVFRGGAARRDSLLSRLLSEVQTLNGRLERMVCLDEVRAGLRRAMSCSQ